MNEPRDVQNQRLLETRRHDLYADRQLVPGQGAVAAGRLTSVIR